MANGSKHSSSRPDDDRPFSIEALSHYARISQAILRLCIANGCPSPNSKLSQNAFIEWLCHNYPEVRAIAGLPALASLDGTKGSVRQTLQLSNTMLTLLEFGESRSSSLSEKAHIRTLVEYVQRAV
ncbi:MAG: hypothetical protein JWL59_3123 [Chthoniobacteraceae bacterium]|nr:hypothetical protein [Chthoniobacteraceae bacterium]